MSDKMDRRNELVGRRGWPVGCFASDGRQLYTPAELAEAGRAAESGGSCPPGVCTPHRGHNLTGMHAETDNGTDARVAELAAAERANRTPAQQPERLGDGGEWVTIGGVEVQAGTTAPVRSLWAWLTGGK